MEKQELPKPSSCGRTSTNHQPRQRNNALFLQEESFLSATAVIFHHNNKNAGTGIRTQKSLRKQAVSGTSARGLRSQGLRSWMICAVPGCATPARRMKTFIIYILF